jgi:hypothetical protein
VAYEERSLRRQRIRYNSDNDDNPIVYQLVVDGAKVTPSSATIAIDNPSGTEKLAAVTMGTPSGTLFSYSVNTTTVADFPVGNGYRADIVVTVGSTTYNRHLMIDVVKFLLHPSVGRDQLLARDAGILAAEHAGDEDLSPLIEACQDELHLKLEAKAFADEQVMDTMIIDETKLAIPARAYILEAFYRHNNPELADSYELKFRELWSNFVSAIKYDKDGDGLEDTQGETVHQRLVT